MVETVEKPGRGSAYLLGVVRPGGSPSESKSFLEELSALADTAGFDEAGRNVLALRRITPATFIGSGQAEEVAVMAKGLGASVVAVDEELTPAQARNLEKVFDLPVVDRAGLIIDIFASRARSREARTQVEIAQLEYLLPRLAGRWTHLSRQVGGGPGGTKGEGEKQIELDRRMIRRRIDRLRQEFARMLRARKVRRQSRQTMPQAALVGYTNVGKSSLFNRLVEAGVMVEDRLFATLDPTVRRVELGQRGAFLIKDTVGFIRKLPHHLVASFKSTFEEAGEADLLVIVVDLAHPSGDNQRETVERVLEESDLGDIPRILVYNKIDAVSGELVAQLREQQPEAVFVSAHTGEGFEHLVSRVADRLLGKESVNTLEIPCHRGDLIARAHQLGCVEKSETIDSVVRITLRASGKVLAELSRLAARS